MSDTPESTHQTAQVASATKAARGSWKLLASSVLLALAGLAFLAVGTLAMLRYVLVPNIPRFKPEIEAQVSKRLGTPTTIGDLAVSWSEWNPVIDASEVKLKNREGETALALGKVHTQLSWRSLVRGTIVFERLDLGSPDLMIKRLPDGKLQVAGLDIDPFAKSDDDSLNQWLVEQRRISIRGATLRWIDQLRNAPIATFHQADLDFANAGLEHVFKLHGDLSTASDADGKPAHIEGTASFTHPAFQGLGGNKADFSQWSGDVYVEMTHASLAEIRRYVDLPFAIERGDGSARAWVKIDKSTVQQATADVALEKVKVQLANDMPWLDLERLSGRLLARPQAIAEGGLELGAENLAWQEAGRPAVKPTNIALKVEQGRDAEKGKGSFSASSLDIGELQRLSRYVKLPKGVNAAIERHAPQGLLSNVQASWQGQADAPREYDFKTAFTNLSLRAVNATQLPGPARQQPELNPGTPGFKSLSGNVHFTQQSGEADVRIENGLLQFPGVLDPDVIAVDKLKAQLSWKRETAQVPDGNAKANVPVWRVDIVMPEFMNPHAAGSAKATWKQDPIEALTLRKAASTGAAFAGLIDHSRPGILDLQGNLQRANAAAVWQYLPISIPQSIRSYLQNAIQSGVAKDAQFVLSGDLYHFPFALDPIEADKAAIHSKPQQANDWRGVASSPNETFRIVAHMSDVNLDYVPASKDSQGAHINGWPAAKNISGQLIFDRVSMQIKDTHGTITPIDAKPVKLSRVNGRIADFRQKATLELSGNTQGALSDYLAYVRATPINTWTAKALDQAKAEGLAELDLKLGLPLYDMRQATVEGKLKLDNNDLQITPLMPRFTQAKGLMTFTEKGFQVKPMRANFLGGEANIEGGTQEDRSTAFTATGTVTAQALKQESTLGVLALVAARATGQAPYDAKVLIRSGQPEITVNTPLTGMALDFPAPLGKTADSSLPVKYSTQLLNMQGVKSEADASSASQKNLRDLLSITIGSDIGIQYEREIMQSEQGVQIKVLRGGIGVSNPVVLPDSGVFANVAMKRFDADAWGGALRRMPTSVPAAPSASTSAQTVGTEPTQPLVDDTPLSTSEMMQNPYIPNVVALQVDELMAGKKAWNKVVAGATFKEGQWQANVDSVSFSGYLAWRAGTSVGSLGKVTARLGRLSVPKDNRDFEQLLDEPPDQLPAIDLVAEEFELGGKQMGRLELDALNLPGRTREWQLRRLAITNSESTLTAQGNWLPVIASAGGGPALKAALTPSKRVSLNFVLDVTDSGALLTRFGIPKTIKDGAGRIEGKLNWIGSPTALDFPTLGGNITMKMEKGQFLKQDPGIARLLGVLSLQTLPRRISLDFRDVFSEGFVFDEVTADALVERGIARTNNFRMKGTQANVLMEGSADISKETQNLYVIVEPDINLGTASLAYIAINPAIGLTTFFLQWLARNSLNKALAFEYRVTGPWVNPKVEKVDTRLKEKTPNGDEGSTPKVGSTDTSTSTKTAGQ